MHAIDVTYALRGDLTLKSCSLSLALELTLRSSKS